MPISAGDLVCVTGANGFIASYLVRSLLQAGFRVRGTVRNPDDPAKTQHLLDLAAALGASDRLSLVAGDLMKSGSFDDAIAGCDAVCHCAAAVFFSASDPQREIVDPSVNGTRNVFESIQRAGTVRRVVHTSSVVAIYGWDKPPGYVFTEADWNTSSTLQSDPYGLAKVRAEQAAREFVDALPDDERFELVHLNPGMVWGPPMIKRHVKASPRLLRGIISRENPGVPKLMLNVVDVRDVAEAHVRALTAEDPPPRCLLSAEDAWMTDIAQRLQQLMPDVQMGARPLPRFLVLLVSLFDKTLNTTQLSKLIGRSLAMDSALSRSAYKMTYTALDDTLRDTADRMISEGWARVTRR
jgi:dihydroflavonol-4-reductase